MKILVVGDIHGEWWHLNKLINKKNPDMILQAGDFGYWPTCDGTTEIGKARFIAERGGWVVTKPWHLKGIKNRNTTIHWCDGNHEDHWRLQNTQGNDMGEGIIYQPRGSILTLADGRNVLFVGGAESIDKKQRTLGMDYFPDETITMKDVIDIPGIRIDIVVSHTCPEEFIYGLDINYCKMRDPSCRALSMILEVYKPKLWYFGHWHQCQSGYKNGCYWTALNMANDTGWWRWLK